jgi:8-amino-3,8-dideoxy-alpha-D-manno-octulosonate transaminase
MYITDQEEIKILEKIILNKEFFRNKGPNTRSQCDYFETAFAKQINTKYSLLVTSGTNALIAALTTLNLKINDEIIIPSFTFFATAVAVIKANATPKIVNIDHTFSIDPIEVEKSINHNTKGIVVVHMDGHACNMEALLAISQKYNIPLIEDVAQSCGGSYNGAPLGSLGEIGCFSFNVDKIISCGEGGAITTNSREIYEKCLCIQDASCSFGNTHKNSFTLVDPFIGQSMRVSEISGALMNVQLARLELIITELNKRRNIFIEVIGKNNCYLAPLNDPNGDCGTSINFLFSDPIEVKERFLEFNKNKISAIPTTSRPAHFCLQWLNLLKKERPHFNFEKSQYLSSIDLVSRCLRLNINFELTLDETYDSAKMLKQILV